MNTMDAILSRRSIRSYTGEQVTDEELEKLILAAWASPVGMHQYEDVHLTVIRNADLLAEIEKNTNTIFGTPADTAILYGAPALILVSVKAPEPGAENVPFSNAASVVENIALEATELGVGVVHIWGAIMALQKNEQLIAKLGLPEGFIPACAAAIGKTDQKYTLRDVPADQIGTNYID